MIDAQWVKELTVAEDPLPVVWKAIVKLWETSELPDDLKVFYDKREEEMHKFEWFLLDSFPELYDDILLKRSVAQNGEYVRRWLVDNNAVIVADSLSVREAVLLRHYFPELDWDTDSPFAIAPFPTLTESLSRKLLNVDAPSNGRDTNEFSYRYIAGMGGVEQNYPDDRPLLIWLRLPDAELDQVTEAQTTRIADVLERTREVLEEMFSRLGERKVIITSDHGYFYGANTNHFDDPLRAPTEISRHNRRAYEKSQVRAAQREYFVEHSDWLALKGRYWRRSGGQNAPHTAHGGLSLAEVFVPILTIQV